MYGYRYLQSCTFYRFSSERTKPDINKISCFSMFEGMIVHCNGKSRIDDPRHNVAIDDGNEMAKHKFIE